MIQTLGKRPANDWLKTVLDVTPLSVLFRLKNVVYDVAALYTVKYLNKGSRYQHCYQYVGQKRL